MKSWNFRALIAIGEDGLRLSACAISRASHGFRGGGSPASASRARMRVSTSGSTAANASTTRGSNWLPAPARTISSAASRSIAFR